MWQPWTSRTTPSLLSSISEQKLLDDGDYQQSLKIIFNNDHFVSDDYMKSLELIMDKNFYVLDDTNCEKLLKNLFTTDFPKLQNFLLSPPAGRKYEPPYPTMMEYMIDNIFKYFKTFTFFFETYEIFSMLNDNDSVCLGICLKFDLCKDYESLLNEITFEIFGKITDDNVLDPEVKTRAPIIEKKLLSLKNLWFDSVKVFSEKDYQHRKQEILFDDDEVVEIKKSQWPNLSEASNIQKKTKVSPWTLKNIHDPNKQIKK